jgi:hypothetical protein
MCDDESLRSRLWSTGYKISSKRMDQFLDYLIDKDMVTEPTYYEGEEEEEENNMHEGLQTTSNGDMLEHMVDILEHNMNILTQSIIKHCNKIPSFPKPPEDWMNNNSHMNQSLYEQQPQEPAHEKTRTRNNKKKKSDPVLMYHKMQSIWSKNRVH